MSEPTCCAFVLTALALALCYARAFLLPQE